MFGNGQQESDIRNSLLHYVYKTIITVCLCGMCISCSSPDTKFKPERSFCLSFASGQLADCGRCESSIPISTFMKKEKLNCNP
jgi:hypothetical protein